MSGRTYLEIRPNEGAAAQVAQRPKMNPAQREATHALHLARGRSICTRGACPYAAPYAPLAHSHCDVLQRIAPDGVDIFSRNDMSVADEAVEEVGRYNGALGMSRDDNGVSSVEIGDPLAVCEKVSI